MLSSCSSPRKGDKQRLPLLYILSVRSLPQFDAISGPGIEVTDPPSVREAMLHGQHFTLKGGQEGITYGHVEVGDFYYTSRISDRPGSGHIGIIVSSRAILPGETSPRETSPREASWASDKYIDGFPTEILRSAHTILPKFQVEARGFTVDSSDFD